MMTPEEKKDISKIPETWGSQDLGDFIYKAKPKKKMNFATKLFLISLGVFLISMGILAFSILTKSSSFSESKVLVSAKTAATITSGEDGEVSVTITNSNKIPITEAYIIATYDSGESFSGDKNIVNERVEIGDILPGTSVTKTFNFLVFGAEGIIKEIKPVFYYKIPQSKAEFNKDINLVSVTLKTSPISINVRNLKEIHQNHDLVFEISIKNNTREVMKDLIVSARNPNDFVYATSTEEPYNNIPSWIIKELPANAEKKIKMTGKLIGNIGNSSKFSFYVGVSKQNTENDPNIASTSLSNFDNYSNAIDNVYSKAEKNVLITGQYLDVSVAFSSLNSSTVRPGESASLEFNYKNNLYYPLDNVVFSVKFEGDVFDFDSVFPTFGSFDKESGIAIWDSTLSPTFSQLSALETGKLYITFRIKNEAQKGDVARLTVSAIGDRNAESLVSNIQDISIEKSWTVSP